MQDKSRQQLEMRPDLQQQASSNTAQFSKDTHAFQSGERHRWAVCPSPIESSDTPVLFIRETDARAWQDETVIPATIWADEASLPGDTEEPKAKSTVSVVPIRWLHKKDACGHNWIALERLDGKDIQRGVGAYRDDPGAVVSPISPNELPPGYQQEIRRREQGYPYLVPLNWLEEHQHGHPYTGRRFCDFLPLEKISAVPVANLEADIEGFFLGQEPELAFHLGGDWQFEHIEADAMKCQGHMFRGRVILGLPHQLAMIVHDLETALRRIHSKLAGDSTAAFWTSWCVWRHIADWAPRVEREMIQQGCSALTPIDVRESVRFLHRQLWAYAEEVKKWEGDAGGGPESSNNAKQRGRRRNQERRDAIRSTISKHGADWRNHLTEIFNELDSKEVSLGDFQGKKIDLGDGTSQTVQKWEDLDLADDDAPRRIIDALRKYIE